MVAALNSVPVTTNVNLNTSAAGQNSSPTTGAGAGNGAAVGNGNAANGVAGGQPGQNKQHRDRSYAIDKQIEEDRGKFKRECKILLLGEYTIPLLAATAAVLFRSSASCLGSPASQWSNETYPLYDALLQVPVNPENQPSSSK